MTTPRTTVSAPTAGAYRLDPDTTLIHFTTRHLFGLAPVRGSFRVVSGELTVAQPLTASRLEATASVASFDTGNPKRDSHVRSKDFLDAARHPHIVFRSTALVRDGGSWVLRGLLTARGQDAPLVLHVTQVQEHGGVLTLRAAGTVDRFAHGLVAMPRMAGRRLALRITATAVRV